MISTQFTTSTGDLRRKVKVIMPLQSEPVEFPIWRGCRGLINTVLCGILGIACAIGLAQFAEYMVVCLSVVLMVIVEVSPTQAIQYIPACDTAPAHAVSKQNAEASKIFPSKK